MELVSNIFKEIFASPNLVQKSFTKSKEFKLKDAMIL